MGHKITSTTLTGTIVTNVERTAVEIVIDNHPMRPLSMRLYYSDITKVTNTPAGGTPTTEITDVTSVGVIEVTAAELQSLPVFPQTYQQLKQLADFKAATEWPDISADPTT